MLFLGVLGMRGGSRACRDWPATVLGLPGSRRKPLSQTHGDCCLFDVQIESEQRGVASDHKVLAAIPCLQSAARSRVLRLPSPAVVSPVHSFRSP